MPSKSKTRLIMDRRLSYINGSFMLMSISEDSLKTWVLEVKEWLAVFHKRKFGIP
jgi:hypothetical protein